MNLADAPRQFVEEITAFAKSDAVEILLNGLQATYEQDWAQSKPEDKDRREHLYHMVRAVEGLKSEIRRVVQSDAVDLYNRGASRKPTWS